MDIEKTRYDVGAVKPIWLEQHARQEIIVPPEARILKPISVLHLMGSADGRDLETLVNAARVEAIRGRSRFVLHMAGLDEEAVSSAAMMGIIAVGLISEGNLTPSLDGYELTRLLRIRLDEGAIFRTVVAAAVPGPVETVLRSLGIDELITIWSTVSQAVSEAFPDF